MAINVYKIISNVEAVLINSQIKQVCAFVIDVLMLTNLMSCIQVESK